jgi:hypothetical protein
VGVPLVQRLVVGALLSVCPFAVPHAPLTAPPPELLLLDDEVAPEELLTEHCAVVPPLMPAQLQLHGPLPLTGEAVPPLHRSALGGAEESVSPFTAPQVAFTTPKKVTALETFRLRVIDCHVPPNWPAGTVNTVTVTASVPFGICLVSTVRLYVPCSGIASALTGALGFTL